MGRLDLTQKTNRKKRGFNIGLYVIMLPSIMKLLREKNKHLLEVAYAIIFSMNILKYLLGEAVLTTSYLINKMLARVLKFLTPLDCLKNLFLIHEYNLICQ